MYRVKILSWKVPEDNPSVMWLRARGCEVVIDPGWPGITEDELVAKLEGVHAVGCGTEPFTRRVLERLPHLKTIARTGVGFNSIDLVAAQERDVAVTITPGANRHAVADHVFGFMLMLAHRLPENQAMVAAQKWTRVVGRDVFGATLGIIGVGAIGREVARRSAGFSMPLLGYDIAPDEAHAHESGLRYVELDELMRRADFITLHVPYYAGTHHLVGARELALAKPTSYVINTARGGVLDEDALHRALVEKRLAGAALDVAENEPNFASPLMGLPSVIWTPHVAGITHESRLACLAGACENIWAVLGGEGEFERILPGAVG